MQNLVILMDASKTDLDISKKAGQMCLNRFCIDEDAAFELSGVHYLALSFFWDEEELEEFDDEKTGKGYFWECFICCLLCCFICFDCLKHILFHIKNNSKSMSLILLSKKLLKAKQKTW